MIIFLALAPLSEGVEHQLCIFSACCAAALQLWRCLLLLDPCSSHATQENRSVHSPPPPPTPSLSFPRPPRREQRGQTASGRPLISPAPQRPDQKSTSLGSPPPRLQPNPRSEHPQGAFLKTSVSTFESSRRGEGTTLCLQHPLPDSHRLS